MFQYDIGEIDSNIFFAAIPSISPMFLNLDSTIRPREIVEIFYWILLDS